VFITPLREGEILSDKEITGVFSNIEAITRTNKALLVELETRIAECKKEVYGNINEQDLIMGERLLIGPTFSQLAAYLKMYAIYTNNQQSSMELVKTLQSSNARFARFLEEQLANPICAGLPLISFLIKPVQRLCKYPLLLRELIRVGSSGVWCIVRMCACVCVCVMCVCV
jgi:RhoGEF domain